jgi:hypothetical protein
MDSHHFGSMHAMKQQKWTIGLVWMLTVMGVTSSANADEYLNGIEWKEPAVFVFCPLFFPGQS